MGACSRSTKSAGRRPFPSITRSSEARSRRVVAGSTSSQTQNKGPRVRSGKLRTWPASTIFGIRWSLAPAIVGILSQTRLPKCQGGETQPAAEDGVWSSDAGNRNPSARLLRPYHRRGHCCDESLQPVCDEARDPLRVSL